MKTLLLTIVLAFIITALALAALGISWLLTGKCKISPGACGRDPTKKREDDGNCEIDPSCSLCKKEKKNKNVQ